MCEVEGKKVINNPEIHSIKEAVTGALETGGRRKMDNGASVGKGNGRRSRHHPLPHYHYS